MYQPNMDFWNKYLFTNITVEMAQTASYVTEKVKENYIVKLLKTFVLYFCNKRHLLRCQFYLNELITASVGKLGWAQEAGKTTRMANQKHLWADLIEIAI